MGYFTQAKQSRSQQPKPTAKRCFIWCSKCHINPRPPADKPSNFDKSAFDRWCSSCYANTPLIERSRKCSRGEKNKLLQRQQEAREKLTKERAEVMAARLAKMEEAKKKRRGTTAKPKRKKGDDEPFTLDLDYSFLNDDSSSSGERLETDYDRMRRLTAKVSDPTIYQESLENKTYD